MSSRWKKWTAFRDNQYINNAVDLRQALAPRGSGKEVVMAAFGPENDLFEMDDDVHSLTLDELRDLPYQMQVGLDLTTFE